MLDGNVHITVRVYAIRNDIPIHSRQNANKIDCVGFQAVSHQHLRSRMVMVMVIMDVGRMAETALCIWGHGMQWDSLSRR